MRRLAMFIVALVLSGGIFCFSSTALGAAEDIPVADGEDAVLEPGVSGGDAVPEPDVPSGDAVLEPSVSDGDALPVALGLGDDTVYNVAFPADTTAYFDPGNLSGRGQIFSDEFEIENYGNRDVAIQISGIEILYAQPEEAYQISAQDITDHRSETKSIHLEMVWKDAAGTVQKVLNIAEGAPEGSVLFLEASEYGADGEFIRLQDGSRGSFSFTGTLNANPDLEWADGEIILRFAYEIVSQ